MHVSLALFSYNGTVTSKESLIILLSSGMKFTEEREVDANLKNNTNQCHLCPQVYIVKADFRQDVQFRFLANNDHRRQMPC